MSLCNSNIEKLPAVTGGVNRWHLDAPITLHRHLGDNLYEVAFHAPAIASSARPGQFLHIRCLDEFSLRRPFSVYWAEGDQVAIFFDVRGRGTRALAERREGDGIDLLGPLGTSFTPPQSGEECLLVAGGIGYPPMCFLAEQALAAGARPTIIYGARFKERLAGLDRAADRGISVLTVTEDGSAGRKGLVTSLLTEMIAERQPDRVYACGPNRMLAAVADLCAGRPAELALEAQMGCGLGVCLSCVIPARGKQVSYLRVCTEGPVFPADVPDFEEIDW